MHLPILPKQKPENRQEPEDVTRDGALRPDLPGACPVS